MAIGSGGRVTLAYIEETVRGETPASPELTYLRTIGRNVNLEKDILESQEVRASRQRLDVRHGFNRVAGTPAFELSVAAYDDFLRFLLGGTWNTVGAIGAPDLGATAPDTFTRSTGSFSADGIRPGDLITTTGFTNGANNVTARRVLTVGTTSLTVASPALITEAQGAGRTLTLPGRRIDVGTNLITMTLERAFEDIAQFQVFRGVAVDQMSLTVSPEAIVNGTFTLLGMSSAAFAGATIDTSGTKTAAPTNSPFAAFDGVLYEGGTIIAVATSLNFTVNNQRTLEGVIGSKFSPDVFEGVAISTGELVAFFEDATMQNKFFNETGSSLWLRLNDLNGTDWMDFKFYNVKYTGGSMDPGQTGPVSQSLPFEALEHPTFGTSIAVQRSNA